MDAWDDGAKYEPYVGRWSRGVAARFIEWLAVPSGGSWLDFGCGTGALTAAILEAGRAREVVGCDRSPGYVAHARERIADPRARFVVATLPELPRTDGGFVAVVTGLVLNFLPDPLDGLRVLAAAARPGGNVAAYVWDYADGMQLMRVFWDTAVALDPAARPLDEGLRFPLCGPEPLRRLFESAGLAEVEVRAIEVPTTFRDFNDYWSPFLGGQGPAPGYAVGLNPERRAELRDAIRRRLPVRPDGSIALMARAWAVKGRLP